MYIYNCHLFFHLRFLFLIFVIGFLAMFIQFIYIRNCYQHSLYNSLFFSFIFISWRLITLQYCSGFCHTLSYQPWIYMYSPSLYNSWVLIFHLLVKILDLLEEKKFQSVVLFVTTHIRVCFYGPVNLKNNLIRYISTNSNFLSENTVDLLFSFLQRLRLNIWNKIIIEEKIIYSQLL